MSKRSRILLPVLLLLASVGCELVLPQSASGFAQQTSPANVPADEVGKTLERCLVEVEHLRAICKSSQDLKAVEERAKSAENLLAVYRSQIEQQKALNETRASVDVLITTKIADDEKLLKSYEGRLADANAQIAGLKLDRSRLRRTRNIFGGLAVALGIAIGFALSN